MRTVKELKKMRNLIKSKVSRWICKQAGHVSAKYPNGSRKSSNDEHTVATYMQTELVPRTSAHSMKVLNQQMPLVQGQLDRDSNR